MVTRAALGAAPVKHWDPHSELAEARPHKVKAPRLRAPGAAGRWARVDSFEAAKPQRRQADGPGALAGLLLVASACAALCVMLYQVTGPRDTFAAGEGPVD